MTVGEWLALLERQREVAWGELRRLAELIARTLTRGSPNAAHEAEELAADVAAELFVEGAAGLRRAQPEIQVWSWLVGTLRTRLASGIRAKPPVVFGDLSSVPAPTRQEGDPAAVGVSVGSDEPTPTERVEWSFERADSSVLTPRQRETYELFREGMSIAAIARKLKLDRHTVHDRIERGLRRLRDGPRPPPPDRGWALPAAGRRDLDEGTRILLRKFAAWTSYGELARIARSARGAVKQKIRRLRNAEEGLSRR